MLEIIMNIFQKAKARVLQNGETKDTINSTIGVLQGGILSP